MLLLNQLFIVAALLAVGLAILAVQAPGRMSRKLTALGLALALLPIVYLAFNELLGRAKPMALEWWLDQAPEATVLGSLLREDDGIHLWLLLDDVESPRGFVLPWDQATAEALHEALEEAERNGTGVRMRLPFERSWDSREPQFYALPQPALPAKPPAAEGPFQFEHPGDAA